MVTTQINKQEKLKQLQKSTTKKAVKSDIELQHYNIQNVVVSMKNYEAYKEKRIYSPYAGERSQNNNLNFHTLRNQKKKNKLNSK